MRAHECRLQSSVVLSLLHLLRFVIFSLVGTSVFCTEKKGTGTALSGTGLARHDFMYEFRGPRSTLDLGSALGAGDAGRERERDCS